MRLTPLITQLGQQGFHGSCLRILVVIYAIAIAASAPARVPAKAVKYPAISIEQAEAWCDSVPLHTPEGIYAFPRRNAVVLVRATAAGHYEIVCVECRNLLIPSGQVIGYISPTGHPTRLRVSLYTDVSLKALTRPREYSATLHPSHASISIDMPTTKYSFNVLALIPTLRRLLRIEKSDPASSIPTGLIRIYPPDNGSGSTSTLLPRYF